MLTSKAAMKIFLAKCKQEYRDELRKVAKAPCMEIIKEYHRDRLKAKLAIQTEAAQALLEILNGTEGASA